MEPRELKGVPQCYGAGHLVELALEPSSSGTQPRALSWVCHSKPNRSQDHDQMQENPCYSSSNKEEIWLLNVDQGSRCLWFVWVLGNVLRDPDSLFSAA